MFKRFVIWFSVFLLCGQLYAHSGMFSGEKKLRVAKTKWFDIIYPARCEESAAILYEKADELYEEVTLQYGFEPAFRMPVVITPAVDQFNAFWTAVPYNHIAIYDTGLSGSSELAVFSETLLSTFRHELTHAVTYNMKNTFWRGVGKIFGDCISPGMSSITTGMAEGATVTSESAAGEGRLNDEYAKHYVKQAKIENAFPAYHDVTGAADISPYGAPYYFHGAFHQWLQEKYGMDAYADFWYRTINLKNLILPAAFKKAYGVSMNTAWKEFVNDYEVPELAANPVKAGLVQDFFEPKGSYYSRMNDAGSLYTSPAAAVTPEGYEKLVWVDSSDNYVFSATASPELSVKKLFSHTGLNGVRLSNDGLFLTVNYISSNSATPKACVKIYNFETGSFYSVPEKGLKESVVVKNGDSWYLIGQKYFARHYSIAVYKLLVSSEGSRIRGIEAFAEVKLEPETNPYEFTALKDGNFAWLQKKGLSYSLCISSPDGSLLKKFDFPEGMTVRSLSSQTQDAFYFSYAQKGTLPRLGKLLLSGEGKTVAGHLYLSREDLSGGVFEPVYWNGKVVYIGEFLRQSRILCMEDLTELSDKEAVQNTEVSGINISNNNPIDNSSDNPSEIPSKAYNPLPYLAKGVLFPVCIYKSNHTVSDVDYYTDLRNIYVGATYFTANPWVGGTEDLIILTGGWNFTAKNFGTSLIINKGTATRLLNSETELKSEFNSKGWKKAGGILTLSSGFGLGNISTITLTNTASALFYNQNPDYYAVSDVATVLFSTIRKAGPGRFEKRGFSMSFSYGRWYDAVLQKPSYELLNASSIAAGAKICFPKPLPFVVSARLLPSSKDKDDQSLGRTVFDATVEATAYSIEIQKAIPGIPVIYLNDLYFNFGYTGAGMAGSATKDGFQTALLGDYFKAVADGRGCYLDSIFIKTGIELTPNYGFLANPDYKINLYSVFSYSIHTETNKKPGERFGFSLGFSINGF